MSFRQASPVTLGAAAATAVAVVVASGGDVTPAYAVQPSADGTVTVRIHSLRDAAGLQRSLRAAGIPAVVDYAGNGDCAGGGASTGRADSGPSLSGPAPGPGAATTQLRTDADGAMFMIDPGELKAGQKVFISTSTGDVTSLALAIGKRAPGAPCDPSGS